ncbi:MAG: cytochrome b/b6 domain-containing protein [Gammaproteobacteria bacterium]|nr:cytochrome b/b6 domain-containing protein [Gammaproteobacteria bacterium]
MTRLYSPTLIVMHWLLAILIGAQLSLATVLPTGLHVTLGFSIGLLTLWRLVLRPEPEQLVLVHEPGSKAVRLHLASYVLIGAVCVSGFAGIMLPHLEDTLWPIHHYLAYTLAALIGLHIAATLYRQWYLKDPVMARMKK